MRPSPRVAIAILAKAPIPGLSKTRLIPSIGAHAAAVLQDRMTERTVATACAANLGPTTVWCAPDLSHPAFRELVTRHAVTLRRQPLGDLGARMRAAIAAGGGAILVIGTDCPALNAETLRAAATALQEADVVLSPAEDGGYVLIGAHAPHPQLFSDIAWGTDTVLSETRARVAMLGLTCIELPTLWDVDTEVDLARCQTLFPEISF